MQTLYLERTRFGNKLVPIDRVKAEAEVKCGNMRRAHSNIYVDSDTPASEKAVQDDKIAVSGKKKRARTNKKG